MTDLIAELAECPFCGSEARRGKHDIPAVQCSNDACGASLHRYHREEAYALWNKRAYHAEIEEMARFHAFFADKCERLFHAFGEDAIDLYNQAAKAMHDSAREGGE